MPKVPYDPYSTAQPDPAGEHVSVNAPAAAFGGNVGQAIENLGSTGQQVSGELYQRAFALQELKNQTDSRNAQTDFATQATMLHAKFSALEGQAAADQLPQFLKDQQTLRENIRGGLKSPMAQQYYDADSLPFMQRNIFSAGSHAGEAMKQGVIGTAQATVDIAAKTFVDPKNENEYDHKIDTVTSAADTIAGAKNWSEPQKQDYILTQTSKLRAAQITQIAHTDPLSAISILDQHKEDMTQQDYDATTLRVQAQNRAVGGVNLATSVYAPDKTFAQMEQEVKDKSPALAHGDPLFEKDALTALRGKIYYDKTAARQDNLETMHSVLTEGILPGVKNVQELRAMPGMAEKIDSLSPEQQRSLPGMINNYNAAKNKTTNDDNFNQLRGMAANDREGFLDLDITKQNVSQAQMNSLFGIRKQLINAPLDDPHLQQAMRQMRAQFPSELRTLGIFSQPKAGADEDTAKSYDHYTGSLQSAIDEWRQVHNAPPTADDIKTKIGPALIQSRSEGYWPFRQTKGSFDIDIPRDVLDNAKQQIKTEGKSIYGQDIEPSDEEAYREVLRQQWKQFYTKAKPEAKPGE